MRVVPWILAVTLLASAPPSVGQEAASIDEQLQKRGVADVIVLLKEPLPGAFGPAFEAFNDPAASITKAMAPTRAPADLRNIGLSGAASLKVDRDQLNRLLANDRVALIAPNKSYPPSLLETATLSGFDAFWTAQSAPETAYAYPPLAVAVLDTGFDISHEFIRTAIAGQACFSRADSTSGIVSLCKAGLQMANGDVVDLSPDAASVCPVEISGCGHGTYVAGIIAGSPVADPRDASRTLKGLDPLLKVIGIQVYSADTSDIDCYPQAAPCVRAFDSSIIQALDHVRSLELKRRTSGSGVRIVAVNLSLGAGRMFAPCDSTSPLTNSIGELLKLGIPTFMPSGNQGYLDAVNEPACIGAAVTVGATTKIKTIWTKTNRSDPAMIDLMATGVDVYSSMPSHKFESRNGTSAAAPVAAAAFGALRAMFPDKPAEEIIAALKSSDVFAVDQASQNNYPAVDVAHADEVLKANITLGPSAARSAPPTESHPSKEFILAINPAFTSEASKVAIERAADTLTARINIGHIRPRVIGPSNIILQTESPVDRDTLFKAMKDLKIPGVSGVFVNKSYSPTLQ